MASDFVIAPTFDTPFRWSVQTGDNSPQINPKLELLRGRTYSIDVEASTTHPFWINTVNSTGSGSAYSGAGLSANGVTTSTTITFTVPNGAPDQLFYKCASHETMSGVIDIPLFKDGFEAPIAPKNFPLRRNILSLSSSELTQLQDVFREIQSRNFPKDYANATYRTSSEFWANIHGVANSELPNDPVGINLVNQCQHGTGLFLAWHRVYVYYFEQLLRKVSGNSTFALPYWNYTTGPLASPTLPVIYQAGLSNNPLFVNQRSVDINNGAQLSGAVVSTATALSLPNFDDFQTALEGVPHSTIHCAIAGGCPQPLMGDPSVAANDPIFWLHHSNIDRLWNCWRKITGTSGHPSPAMIPSIDKPFVFPDPDGNLMVPMDAQQLLNLADQIDVHYEEETNCSDPSTPLVTPIMQTTAPSTKVVVGSKSAVHIPSEGGRFTITVPVTQKAKMASTGQVPRALLRLSHVLNPRPSTMYVMFARVDDNTPEYEIGVLTFFGHAHHGNAPKLFDITRPFAEASKHGGSLSIRLIPTNGLQDENHENVLQQARLGADIDIGSAEILLEQ